MFVVLASGCGGHPSHPASSVEHSTPTANPHASTVPGSSRSCEMRGSNVRGRVVSLPAGFRFCSNTRGALASSIERRDGPSGWRRITGPPNPLPGFDGQWMNILVSPDRKTLLAQWGGDCEVPTAFFVPASGGEPRVVTGEKDSSKAPMSIGLGWQSDGRARVSVLNSGCSNDFKRPGIYLVDPKTGHGTFVRKLRR
jgi:hypothetical protein